MKRQPTEEQKAAAKVRRQKMRELARRIGAMTDTERQTLLARCNGLGVVTIEGRTLSLTNTCMVLSQLATATVVGGFQQWRKAGRCVRKGEHGAAIWFPLMRGNGNGNGDVAAEAAKDGEETAHELRFGLATVFDIGQTDEVTP